MKTSRPFENNSISSLRMSTIMTLYQYCSNWKVDIALKKAAKFNNQVDIKGCNVYINFKS